MTSVAEHDDLFADLDDLVQEYRTAAARLTPELSHQVLQDLDRVILIADRARRSRTTSDMDEARGAVVQARRRLSEARMRGTAPVE